MQTLCISVNLLLKRVRNGSLTFTFSPVQAFPEVLALLSVPSTTRMISESTEVLGLVHDVDQPVLECLEGT